MTERLYYTDSYLTQFQAAILDGSEDGRRVYLDRTAFYPASGGQPCDHGTINGAAVVDVVDEGERIAHVMETPLATGAAEGAIDWTRRFDLMQQHTGQHLLSAVFEALFGMKTLSVHFGDEASTLDLAAGSVSGDQLKAAEMRANEIVCECRLVDVTFEEAASAEGLRKPTGREGEIRVVTITGLDRSACGGTHVRSTGEIGPILLRKADKIRNNVRVEFLCGMRSVRRARADYDALARAARVFSAALDDTPALVESLAGQLKEAEKARRKLTQEAALRRGGELYEAVEPGVRGRRVRVEKVKSGSFDEELRALAQGFTARPGAVFVALLEDPPSVLLAVSKESGLNAGQVLKEKLAAMGGRGGGAPQMAQGTVASPAALELLAQELAQL
jgi:alanyl-tRNA synthetase